MAASDLIDYKQWFQDYSSKALAEYERWRNRHSVEYEKAKSSLAELGREIDLVQKAINSYNVHVLNARRGDNMQRSAIEDSKELVDSCEEKINQLIARINEEIASFRSAGQKRVENWQWWIPRALIVCVAGGLLVLAASFAVTAPLATSWIGGTGLATGAATALGCYIEADNIKVQNAKDDDYLTDILARLERCAETIKSNQRYVQPENDGQLTKRRI